MARRFVWPALNKSELKGINQLKAGAVGIRNECGIACLFGHSRQAKKKYI